MQGEHQQQRVIKQSASRRSLTLPNTFRRCGRTLHRPARVRTGLCTNSIFTFLFLFCKKIIIRANQIHLHGENYSLLFLPATPSSQTLEKLFELARCPSRTLDLPCALLLELQRDKDSVRRGALEPEVLRPGQKQLTQTLIMFLLKTHFLH